METNGVLHDEKHASRLLSMTCDTLLFLKNDGTCVDMIVKTENNPYVNDQKLLVGKNIFDVFPEETVRELRPALQQVARQGEISNANYDLPAPDKMYYFKFIAHKYDEGHLLCQYRDITRRSQMKRRLEMANRRLTETGREAKIGYWTYNTATKIIHYSGFVGVVMNVETEEVWRLEEYLEHVHPEDKEKLVDILQRADILEDTFEFRIVKDRTYYLRLKIVNTYRDHNGDIIIEGYTQNIDDIVLRWDRLKMLSMALDSSNDGIFATKMDGTMVFGNKFCRKQCNLPKDADITKYKVHQILPKFENQEAWEIFTGQLRKNNNAIQYTWSSSNLMGDEVSFDCSAFVFRNDYGEDMIWHLCRDVSERFRYEIELKKAKEKAEESDRLKSAFISNMSHEIRTPLNSIVGFSTILTDIDNPEERKQYLGIIESSNRRLLMLIDEVLDLSKIESGTLEFHYSNIELNDLCREIQAARQFCSSHATLLLDVPEEKQFMKLDKNRVTQVISNLLDNAVKFMEKGTVTWGYKPIPGFVEFFVKDTGIGIPEDKLATIFDRFERVNHFIPGTGLGLSICKSIVERMGGDISVASEVGVGSLFSFRIPLQLPGQEEEREDVKPDFVPASRGKKKEKRTILVAEDNEENFALIQAMIGKEFQLLHARDGIEVLELFEKEVPDLILMDVKMPRMDGMEATRLIREKSPGGPPIIAVSAYAYEADKRRLLEIGCNDFLAKPLDRNMLLETLYKHV
ncbi:MAG: ATP-binding protein [Proteiniphilum sp.]